MGRGKGRCSKHQAAKKDARGERSSRDWRGKLKCCFCRYKRRPCVYPDPSIPGSLDASGRFIICAGCALSKNPIARAVCARHGPHLKIALASRVGNPGDPLSAASVQNPNQDNISIPCKCYEDPARGPFDERAELQTANAIANNQEVDNGRSLFPGTTSQDTNKASEASSFVESAEVSLSYEGDAPSEMPEIAGALLIPLVHRLASNLASPASQTTISKGKSRAIPVQDHATREQPVGSPTDFSKIWPWEACPRHGNFNGSPKLQFQNVQPPGNGGILPSSESLLSFGSESVSTNPMLQIEPHSRIQELSEDEGFSGTIPPSASDCDRMFQILDECVARLDHSCELVVFSVDKDHDVRTQIEGGIAQVHKIATSFQEIGDSLGAADILKQVQYYLGFISQRGTQYDLDITTSVYDTYVRNRKFRMAFQYTQECAQFFVDGFMIRSLLENSQRTWNAWRLEVAAKDGDIQRVEALHRIGTPIDGYPRHQTTPLHEAVTKGQVEMAEYLINVGAQVNMTSPMYGGQSVYQRVMEGQDPEMRDLFEKIIPNVDLQIHPWLLAHGEQARVQDP